MVGFKEIEMDEIWKDVPGYEGLYIVSNAGRIKSCKRFTTSGKIIKQYRNTQTLRQMELSEVVQVIRDQAYGELCKELRRVYPLVEVRQK